MDRNPKHSCAFRQFLDCHLMELRDKVIFSRRSFGMMSIEKNKNSYF